MSDELKPGRELDALIAHKVMGLEVHNGFEVVGEGAFRAPSRAFPVKRYSTDIAAAWEVVDSLRSRFEGFYWNLNETYDGMWTVNFWPKGSELNGDTAPHAICLAALKAVGAV